MSDDRNVWRQWTFEWTSSADASEVVARAIDGTGTVQPSEDQPASPSGATGWVSRTVGP